MRSLLAAVFLAVLLLSCSLEAPKTEEENTGSEGADKQYPYEWLSLQRSYPEPIFPIRAYLAAMHLAAYPPVLFKSKEPGFELNWELQGPANIGGRINAVAVQPGSTQVIYVGAAQGGLFKSTDGGQSWASIFDDKSYLAISSITIDPDNPQTVYVGTGDRNISGYPAIGNGLYRTTNGGETWQHLGLEKESIVSEIILHPDSADVIYAATMGIPFERNEHRGLYKSADGGNSWQKILYLDNQTGIIDLDMDPLNPSVLYATGWTRIRNSFESLTRSNKNRIYKSTDGGQTWNTLAGGLPAYETSRWSMTVSSQDHNKLYAMVVDTAEEFEALYRSANGGSSWTKLSENGLDESPVADFGWYFGMLSLNPADDDKIYMGGVDLWSYDVQGAKWDMASPPWHTYEVHADKHDMIWLSNDQFLLATDGGLYKYTLSSDTWEHLQGLPITQFYRIAVNPHEPGVYYGGAQDNGTTSGSIQDISNWERRFGGDGFQPLIHPYDEKVHYYETQRGWVWSSFSGFTIDCNEGFDSMDLANWDMPLLMSQHDPERLYAGRNRVYENTNGAFCYWSPISHKLTKPGSAVHAPNISALSESRLDGNILYAGTSDGLVWKTDDRGATWVDITGSLPNRYITSVHASPLEKNTVFVTHSGYKDNEFLPHIHASINGGVSWQDISGDLPPVAVNDLLVFPYKMDVLFAATDAGVYGTLNGGVNWHRIGENMPIIPVYDIEYDLLKHTLVAGTFARSMMTYDLDSMLQLPVNIEEPLVRNTDKDLRIYPNPARDRLNIEAHGQRVVKSIAITDLQGKELLIKMPEGISPLTRIDISHLPAGVYLLRVRTNDKTITRKWIKG